MPNEKQYDAFISYSRKDKAFATKLEKALEDYRPPKDLEVPQRHLNVFRDEQDMTGTEYFGAIDKLLQDSAKLIVICSPNSRHSQYVNDEIRRFAKLNSAENIIAVIVAGVPDNEAKAEQETEKAFPTALFDVMEMPLAKDYRGFNLDKDKIDKSPFENAWYGLLSDLYNKSRREIEERDRKKLLRQRRIRNSIVTGVMLALATLAGVALWQRNVAVENAKEAERQRGLAADSARVAQEQRAHALRESNRAADSARVAQDQRNEARQQRDAAQQRLYAANYNFAKIFEEKAGNALADAFEKNNAKDFQKAWLYTLAALNQDIHPDSLLPISYGRLLIPEIRFGAFQELWISPSGTGDIRCLAISSDGTRIACGGNETRIWEFASGKQIAVLPLYGRKCMAFSPDGKLLAGGLENKSYQKTLEYIEIWDVINEKLFMRCNGHRGDVNSIAFSPDGKLLASGSADSTVRLWEVASGQEVAMLLGHKGSVKCVAFSPDGSRLASGSGESIRLWEIANGKPLLILPGGSNWKSSVESVAFSQDGRRLITGSGDNIQTWEIPSGKKLVAIPADGYGKIFNPDGTRSASKSDDGKIHIWEVASGKQIIAFSASGSNMAFSPDGKRLVVGAGDGIQIWEIASGKQLVDLLSSGHSFSVRSVVFSPNGSWLASEDDHGKIRIWEVATGKQLAIFDARCFDYGSRCSLAFSPDGSRLASGSSYDAIRLWEIGSGQKIGEFLIREVGQHTVHDVSVAFGPDGKLLASGTKDSTVYVWEASSGKAGAMLGHPGEVKSKAFSPSGKYLASTVIASDSIRIWELASGKSVKVFRAGDKSYVRDVKAMIFSPDGTRLASELENEEGTDIWEVTSGKLLNRFSGTNAAFSPDGRKLAAMKRFRIWDIDSNQQIGELSSIGNLAFSPDGTRLASGSVDGTIRLWGTASSKQHAIIDKSSEGFVSIAFSPDGKLLASSEDMGGVKLHDVVSKKFAYLPGAETMFSLAFSPDGKRLAGKSTRRDVQVWDLASKSKIAAYPDSAGDIRSVAFSPDGRYLTFVSNNSICLRDAATGKVVKVLSGNWNGASGIAFTPDGSRFVINTGKTVRLLEIISGKEVELPLKQKGFVTSVALGDNNAFLFSPDGTWRISKGNDNICIWDVASGKPLAVLAGCDYLALSPDGMWLASVSNRELSLYNVSHLRYYLRNGKKTETLQRLYDASLFLLPFRLQGIDFVPHERPLYLTPVGDYVFPKPNPFKDLQRPRPLGVDPVDWVIQNLK